MGNEIDDADAEADEELGGKMVGDFKLKDLDEGVIVKGGGEFVFDLSP